jgi:hypothetical protein
MKTRAIILLLAISFSSVAFATDVIDEIGNAIRSGNPANISKYFISNIDLKVISQEDAYSKPQAEMILRDFFAKHPVKSYTVEHKSEPITTGSQYVVGTLQTTNGKFRVYFVIKPAAGAEMLIHQFRIEVGNE